MKACQACYDGAMAYGVPFVSGKDSLSNEFNTEKGERIQIPYTLLISAMSVVGGCGSLHHHGCEAPEKPARAGGIDQAGIGRVHYLARLGLVGTSVPMVDVAMGPKTAQAVSVLVARGLVSSAHDLSEGGLAVALAEMLFAGGLGASVDLAGVHARRTSDDDGPLLFAESASRYLLEVEPGDFDAVARSLKEAGVRFGVIGRIEEGGRLKVRSSKSGWLMDEVVAGLKKSWLGRLDW